MLWSKSASSAWAQQVCAVTTTGIEGDRSGPVSGTTLIGAPGNGNLRVTAVTANSISLIWSNTFNGANGFNIYRSTSETGTYSKINTDAITGSYYTDIGFTDTGLSAYTVYYYKLSAISNSGVEGLQSSPVSASTGIVVAGSNLAVKLAWLQSNAASNNLYDIAVDADESVMPHTLSYSGKSGITIFLSGSGAMRTVNLSANGSLFTVGSGVTLVLDNNITLNGRSANNASLVSINSGGALIMNAGSKITDNAHAGSSSYSYGGGVYNGGTFTMNGGEISGNTATNGGGVCVSGYSGTFTMNGGKISDNTASADGGGIYVYEGTFTMNGGEISDNTASTSGGGVCMDEKIFTMNGGKISGNTASSSGGGVCLRGYASSYPGSFHMHNGEISGNTASAGGGVYQGSYSYFSMGGGVIYGNNAATALENTATSSGAALYKYGGTTQYGTFNGDAFYPSGNLTTTDDTIRVVNGNLLTE